MVARNIDVETGGAGLLVASDARLSRGWVGMLVARNAEVSEDSRVLIDSRGAATIGAIVAGGMAVVAAVSLGIFGSIVGRRRH
jgi:hypothetical protein